MNILYILELSVLQILLFLFFYVLSWEIFCQIYFEDTGFLLS